MIGVIYKQLKEMYPHEYKEFRKNDWWPGSDFEICLGAVLTQNTSWDNVEKALYNLRKNKINSPSKIKTIPDSKLKKLIKPAGFYNQKSKYVRNLCDYILSFKSFADFQKNVVRNDLLKIKGVGKETADSILLYCCDKKEFVVDAYTKRIFKRMNLINEDDYELIKNIFENKLNNKKDYKMMHALIVEHAKRRCKVKPLCDGCLFKNLCNV